MEQYNERIKMMNELSIIVSQEKQTKAINSCPCGYDPFDEHSFFKGNTFQCNSKKALQNHITFPSFAMLTQSDTTSPLYYNINNYITKPRRHWAFIFQIVDITSNENRETVIGSSYFGEIFSTYFNHDRSQYPTTFLWSDLKVGNTIAIIYAEKKTFSDNRHGIEANKLLKDADLKSKSEILECFSCGLKTDNMYRCGSCILAKYCSQACQLKEWNSSHKKLCKQSQALLRLSCLSRHKFKHCYSFNESNQEKYLPPYIYVKKFDQTS